MALLAVLSLLLSPLAVTPVQAAPVAHAMADMDMSAPADHGCAEKSAALPCAQACLAACQLLPAAPDGFAAPVRASTPVRYAVHVPALRGVFMERSTPPPR